MRQPAPFPVVTVVVVIIIVRLILRIDSVCLLDSFKFLPIRLKQLVYFVKFICKTSLLKLFFYLINYLSARKTHSQKDTYNTNDGVKNQKNLNFKLNNFLPNKK